MQSPGLNIRLVLLFDVIVTRQEFLQHVHEFAKVYEKTWTRRTEALHTQRQGDGGDMQQRGLSFAQLYSFSPGVDSEIQFVASFVDNPRRTGFSVMSQEFPNVVPANEFRQEHVDNAEILEVRNYQLSGSRFLDPGDNAEDEQGNSDSEPDSATPPALDNDADGVI
jgi:hypothetical protein